MGLSMLLTVCQVVELEKWMKGIRDIHFFFNEHLGNYHVPGRELADWTQDENSHLFTSGKLLPSRAQTSKRTVIVSQEKGNHRGMNRVQRGNRRRPPVSAWGCRGKHR